MRSAIPFSIWITDNDTNPADRGFFQCIEGIKGKWEKNKDWPEGEG